MRQIRIEKVTLNIGAGKDQTKLEKGLKLLNNISGKAPVKTITMKRIQGWGLRPGLPIGCKVTLRGEKAEELLGRLIKAKDSLFSLNQFDDEGSFSFGIHEYIDIPGVEYDPEIKIMGLQICVTFERKGFRVRKRRNNKRRLPKKSRIKREESIDFMKQKYSIKIKEEE